MIVYGSDMMIVGTIEIGSLKFKTWWVLTRISCTKKTEKTTKWDERLSITPISLLVLFVLVPGFRTNSRAFSMTSARSGTNLQPVWPRHHWTPCKDGKVCEVLQRRFLTSIHSPHLAAPKWWDNKNTPPKTTRKPLKIGFPKKKTRKSFNHHFSGRFGS